MPPSIRRNEILKARLLTPPTADGALSLPPFLMISIDSRWGKILPVEARIVVLVLNIFLNLLLHELLP